METLNMNEETESWFDFSNTGHEDLKSKEDAGDSPVIYLLFWIKKNEIILLEIALVVLGFITPWCSGYFPLSFISFCVFNIWMMREQAITQWRIKNVFGILEELSEMSEDS